MPSFAGRETTYFLIRPLVGKRSRIDQRQLQRLLVYLGGVQTGGGFAFPNSQRRQEAWEVLSDRYGSRYFEKHEQLVVAADPA